MKINFDYLNIFKEPLHMVSLILRQWLRQKSTPATEAVMVVNVCLIGEFAASVPALHAYIEKQEGKPVDLLVSPFLKDIARQLKGVRQVYTASSVFARALDADAGRERVRGPYGTILVMRASSAVLEGLETVETARLRTGFFPMLSYGLHLCATLLIGKTPRPWRDVCFAIVGEPPRTYRFEEMLHMDEQARERVRLLPALQTKEETLIIHTCPSWHMNHWPLAKWAELLARLKEDYPCRFIFIGATRDEPEYAALAAMLPFEMHSLIDLPPLDLLLTLDTCDYFIGVDSGPRNMAHLVDLPSITLLGPGPHMYTPPSPRDIVLDHSGGRGVYQRFFAASKDRYIDRISVEEVLEAFAALRARTDLKAREKTAERP